MDTHGIINTHLQKSIQAKQDFVENNLDNITNIAKTIAICMAKGGKLLLCGNGGSAADAQHIAAEFVNRFKMERPPLPAIALTTDSSIITSIGNDYCFEEIFSKQVQALGSPNDILLGISTSGKSKNICKALAIAKECSLMTIGFTGENSGAFSELCDLFIKVPSNDTAIIQEVHIFASHIVCYLVDYFLFENVSDIQPEL